MIPPTIPDSGPETPSERVALVVWHLAHGEGLTTFSVSQMTHLTPRRAYDLMCRISRVLPIYQDDERVWQVCALRELDAERHDVMVG